MAPDTIGALEILRRIARAVNAARGVGDTLFMPPSPRNVRANLVAALPHLAGAGVGWMLVPDETFAGRLLAAALSAFLIPCVGVLAFIFAGSWVASLAGIRFDAARLDGGFPLNLQLVTAGLLAAAVVVGFVHAERERALRIVECVENRQRYMAMDIRIVGFAETPAGMAKACLDE